MNKQLRRAVIAGNWKMNKTVQETGKLIAELSRLVKDIACEVVVCVPFVDLPAAVEATKGTNISVGAQNCHFEASGAYTGEISVGMLSELGVKYVIIGHSERRSYFGETDITVNKRVTAAVRGGITAILCVGERLEERDQGITNEIIAIQTKIALRGIGRNELKSIIIAYEPVWAIGTGKTATKEQANEVCGHIRSVLAQLYDIEVAESMTIQYGGSMNAKNANELLAMEHVDGGLIGGASLVAVDFVQIITAAAQG